MTPFKDNSTEEKWLKIKHHLKLVDHPVPQSWVLWLMGLHSADQTRISELEAVISNARAMVDHVIHGEISITSMQDIHSDLSEALKAKP